jgi:protein-S-isoprenylcysteine O-methyltransferase Ste14
MSLRIISIAGFVLMAAALITLLSLRSFFANSTTTISLQIAGVVLMVYARVTFGIRSFHLAANPTEGGLVTSGPYHFIRHPIYASVLLFVVAGVISHISAESIILLIVLMTGVTLRIYSEEKLVVLKYPEYSSYAAKTKRIIPFIL